MFCEVRVVCSVAYEICYSELSGTGMSLTEVTELSGKGMKVLQKSENVRIGE